MGSQVSLVRIAMALAIGLVLLGSVGLFFTENLWDGLAAARGYVHARFDLLLGKRELHVSAYRSSGRPSIPTNWLMKAGYEYSLKHYRCVGSTPCYSYHETYDAQARRAINRDFGYDIFAEYAAYRHSHITIMIEHE